ncbi:TonB-linked outer membrane protein, SusC/RagA family [Pedobacter steynii]|uniref:TonB-linked outer membrane protein, SusC/RagA family n=1 Tax=Pedobacter steynii TaxID=430522 RepID=A0A1G9L772_9SPHI|nr:SusC/RagA family TonB-linked outer membrane protein [Pedobacter steynii]NQX38766.1 SusC/RagA family TonB-linked outer membrane protein [Pedobacter steynii]SDL57829.1 TonB-linked outer membrane protein, SusC/RagA family [Pedobacter steynii]
MKLALFHIILLFCGVQAFGQKIITGKIITSESKQPLPGATIKSIPGNTKSLAKQDGIFNISVDPRDSILEVSCIGYLRTRVYISSSALPFVISMKAEEKNLKEVIISSGYQQLPKERATGSFTAIGNKRFNEQVSTDILSRLPAIANGLIADNSTTAGEGKLMIRGLSTINGPKAPLIVLDNFPYEGNIDNINPNDVESITLLKDAAASSIWGARAGNGVIVITTKKGAFNKPLSIGFNINTTLKTKPNLGYLRQMSSSDFIDVEEMLYKNKFYESRINNSNKPPLTPVVELLIKHNGDITNPDYRKNTALLRTFDVRRAYHKYMYQVGLNQQYALNLDGGSQKHNWIASAGYDRNSSILNEKYQRFNLRFGHTYQPLKDLRITTDIYYTLNSSISGRPGYDNIKSAAYDLYPYARFADDSGNPLTIAQKRQSYIESLEGGKLLDWNYYPLLDYKHSQNTTSTTDILFNTGINYTLFKGLNADLKYQYERQQSTGKNHRDKDSYFSRNLVNTYTQINPSTGEVIYRVPKGGILDLSNHLLLAHNLRGQLNFNRVWNKHEVHLIGGTEFRGARSTGNNYRMYGYNADILAIGQVDYTNQYPEYISKELSYIPENQNLEDALSRFVSVYANGSYTYNDKYIISASARRDASNLFGLNTNDKWNLLWSVGGSWDISKESFYKSNLIPYLRLRTTYGFSGNIDPKMSAVSTIRFLKAPANNPGLPYAQFDNYSNPDLRWETSGMLNFGLDFRFASNRLVGSIEYYRKNGDHLFGNAMMDETYGVGQTLTKNVARIKGSGIDIELSSINIKQKRFSWATDFNFNYNKDEVVDYLMDTKNSGNFISAGSISGVKGKPIFSIFSYKWAGLDPETGDPTGYFDGKKTNDYTQLMYNSSLSDLKYSGQVLPAFSGSLGNTFSYGGLSLSLSFSYKLGHHFRRNSIDYSSLFNRGLGHSDYAARWQQPGDEHHTNIPSMIYALNTNRDTFYSGSSVLVEKADHIRMEYVMLSYSLNQNLVNKLGMKNLSIFFNASNLGIIWRANKLRLDPEYQNGNTLLPSKYFSIGLRANVN